MKPNDFKIVFETGSHEVDVETLIGSLMHTSKIIQEVNKELQTEKKIEVKIKALEKGSFEVHIELVEKLIPSLFSNEGISIAANIVTIVGGLYAFAAHLKGRKPKNIEEQKTGDVIIINDDGNATIIKASVYNVYNENKTVRDSISKQFSILNKNEDISGFKFQSNNFQTYIPDEEFPNVAAKLDALEDNIQEPITEILYDRRISIVRPSFDKDLKWDFIYDGQIISAKVNDNEILAAVDDGEDFSKGDQMLVDLEISRFYDPSLETHLITGDSYKIIKYKGHIKSPKTGKLFKK
ncbi:hypothetical protein ACF3N7_05455 [Cruoricaptor ignavus]|uniref:hypothetical protein n=1 Tax=Cruoricaptor ignavus TaxID=1118202 RepID=UPI00370D9460